ncbi:hypothetical protein [Xenophilus azovorans]|uniref:hypothetical protein n=1 Tax=Xenophilus azovorans TaxID=151755 RepID=UPI0005707942|nr:hypothetical protein [Xenophilus azovorans]
MTIDTPINTPANRAGVIAADLYDRIALDRDGQPFRDDDPDTWDEAEASEPKIVSLGQVRLRVLEDRDAEAIAKAAGAITDDGPPVFCLIAELDQSPDAPVVRSMQQIVLEAEGVPMIFTVWLTGNDVHAPPPAEWGFTADAHKNAELSALRPGEVLLVMESVEVREEVPEARQQAVAALQGVVLHIMNRMGVGDTPFDAEEATALRLALDGDLRMPTLQRIAERDAELAGALARVVKVVGATA